MTDPFFIRGPAVVNFSGGRSSGLLLRRALDAHHGVLPDDVHVVFANTGRERSETLAFVHACEVEWGVRIRWVQRAPGPHRAATPPEARFVEVDYDSAAVDGEPFEQLIRERRYLPNSVERFCTSALKIEVAESFMRAQGYETWLNVIGLRRDEGTRVAKHRRRNASGEQDWITTFPLYEAQIVKADVAAYWSRSPFDLALQSWEGNCDLCLAGETEVVTAEGIKPIRELAGTTPNLLIPKISNGSLSEVGAFAPAPVRSFGVQRLWRVDLAGHGRARKVVYATAEHRWFVSPRSKREGVPSTATPTSALQPGMKLRRLFRCPIGEERGGSSRLGALRGFVFGDGTVPQGERPGTISVYAGPKLEAFGGLLNEVLGAPAVGSPIEGAAPISTFYGVPRFWKLDLPALDESRHYLIGWLAGWFAADGCVADNGTCILSSARREYLEFARSVCAVLGVQCTAVTEQVRRVKPPGGAEREHTIYGIKLNRHHLTRDFFWLRHHQERIGENAGAEERRYGWTVVSVSPTDRVEEVFCAVVEGVGAFGLADGLMTGNCFFKKRSVRERIMREHPEFVRWWARMEQLVGGRFIKNEPPYAVVAEKARRQLPLVVDLDPAEDTAIPCGCTDRRRSRCTCNARWRRGRGHALSCAMVLGRAA